MSQKFSVPAARPYDVSPVETFSLLAMQPPCFWIAGGTSRFTQS